MSSQSIVTEELLPTGEVLSNKILEDSVNLLSFLKYDIGKVCGVKLRNLLRLEKMHCNASCYTELEDKYSIREEIIKKSIRTIKWVVIKIKLKILAARSLMQNV